MTGLKGDIDKAAARVIQALASGALTAWELKMKLKLSHTRLHLTLGVLLERRDVGLEADDLTIRVTKSAAAPEAHARTTPQPSGSAN